MTRREIVHRAFWALLLGVGIGVAWIAMSDPAFAQASGSVGSFACIDGVASGALYDSGPTCPTTLQMDNIFSFLICNMEQLSSNLLGNMYCGMVTSLVPMVIAILTIAVMFFGMGFTVGVIPATAREFQLFLIKCAFVVAFATNAEYMIGYGYRFLVEGAREGIAIALSGLFQPAEGPPAGNATGADIYAYMDRFLGTAIQFATDNIGVTNLADRCKNAIFAVMAIMAVAFPPLFYLSLLIIAKVALTFLRGVFGYIYAIIGIALLLTLSPFFVSFFLFKQTRPYFDKWLGYLVSFSLQMVLVFAFLAFVVSIDVKHITGGLTAIIVPVDEIQETTSLRLPWKYCTLCEFQVYNKESGDIIDPDQYDQFIKQGELRCKDDPGKPIRIFDASAPGSGEAPDERVQSMLLKFAGTGLLSLLVLAYVVDAILRYIPSIAHFLAGSMGGNYAPQLGGGVNPRQIATLDLPGSSMVDSFSSGFERSFTAEAKAGKDSLSASMKGFSDGMKLMIGGASDRDGPRAQEKDPGLIGSFTRFLVNPHNDKAD